MTPVKRLDVPNLILRPGAYEAEELEHLALELDRCVGLLKERMHDKRIVRDIRLAARHRLRRAKRDLARIRRELAKRAID